MLSASTSNNNNYHQSNPLLQSSNHLTQSTQSTQSNLQNPRQYMRIDDENDFLYKIDSLLNSSEDWRNIQDIIKLSFKSILELIKSNNNTIKELERQIQSKASKSDLVNSLSQKANVNDVMKTFTEVVSSIETRPSLEEVQILLDEKVSRNEIHSILSNKPVSEEVKSYINGRIKEIDNKSYFESLIKSKIDENNLNFNKKLQNFVVDKEISGIYQGLDNMKLSILDINESLNTKLNKEIFNSTMNKKANKSEIDGLSSTKVDVQDFQALLITIKDYVRREDLELLEKLLNSKVDFEEITKINTVLKEKVDVKEVEVLTEGISYANNDFNRKINMLNSNLDHLLDTLRSELEGIKSIVNSIDQSKSGKEDLSRLSAEVMKKMSKEAVEKEVVSIRKDMKDLTLLIKTEVNSVSKAVFENVLQNKSEKEEKIDKIQKEIEEKEGEIKKEIQILKKEVEKNEKNHKDFLLNQGKDSKNEISKINDEIFKLNSDLDEMIRMNNLEKTSNNSFLNKLKTEIESKMSISQTENVYSSISKDLNTKIDDFTSQISKSFKVFENEIYKVIEKKTNQTDFHNALLSKAEIGSTNIALQNKVSYQEFDKIKLGIEKLMKELSAKLDISRFDGYSNSVKRLIDDIRKEINEKSSIKETLSIIKNKADIDDVNHALTQIHEELDIKTNNEIFKSAMTKQNLINETLSIENSVGRWIWKSGKMKNGYAIAWDVQSVNTSPENYIFDKEKTSILIMSAGIYEVNLGFYAEKKPTIQILVNGEPIISAVNSASYVIHQSAGRLKNIGKHSYGNITGLTMIDYINLPDRSRISIIYSGEEGGEGFLSLRRLN